MLNLRVGAFLDRSHTNGPGIRSVLWVQGCNRRCNGCFNPDFLDHDGGRLYAVEEIIQWIFHSERIEGVTFSGGEPFLQAKALCEVAIPVKQAGKSIVIFTGFTHPELLASEDITWKHLYSLADLLICGPYEIDHPGNHPLLSSANQELVYRSDRYKKYDFGKNRRVEFRIQPTGDVVRTGFPKHPKFDQAER